ncbi:MAG: hypothetical protein KY393_06365 [Actinobacteria bacterium]|nr:hypothetical protein [Actinomycetota bacterium]
MDHALGRRRGSPEGHHLRRGPAHVGIGRDAEPPGHGADGSEKARNLRRSPEGVRIGVYRSFGAVEVVADAGDVLELGGRVVIGFYADLYVVCGGGAQTPESPPEGRIVGNYLYCGAANFDLARDSFTSLSGHEKSASEEAPVSSV